MDTMTLSTTSKAMAIAALTGNLPYAHAQHTTAMPLRHDRNFTTCMVCGASKTPDQAFCSRECCKEYKVTGAKYSPLTGKKE